MTQQQQQQQQRKVCMVIVTDPVTNEIVERAAFETKAACDEYAAQKRAEGYSTNQIPLP